jgi:hypothetical protein
LEEIEGKSLFRVFSPLLYQLSYPAKPLANIDYFCCPARLISHLKQRLCWIPVDARHQHGSSQYSKALDQRKRRICGLRDHNGAFYAQLDVTDENTGKKIVRRMRLEDADRNPATTAAEAMSKLKINHFVFVKFHRNFLRHGE